jgi:nitroreductase
MKELLPEIEVRRARRALDDRTVPNEVVQRVLRAGTLAASCFNNQPWRFVVVQDAQTLDAIREHLSRGNYWARRAPLILAVATDEQLDCRNDDGRAYALFDTGMATANLVLQATREGLIAHPIAGFDAIAVREALHVPETYTVITLVIIGYPGDQGHLNEKHRALETSPRARKPEHTVVFFDRFEERDNA